MSVPSYSAANLGATGNPSAKNATGNILPKGHRLGRLENFTPDMMQLFSQLFGHVGPESFLSRLAKGEQGLFEEMEAPAMKQFQGLLGQTASRFSGMGSGARHSSGFRNLVGQQTSDFAQALQANRMGLQRQAIMDLMNLSHDLLGQRPYQNFLIEEPSKQSWWQKALGIGLPVAGAVAGGVFGGPAGAAMGGQLGSQLGGSFTGSQSSPNYSGIGNLPTNWKT